MSARAQILLQNYFGRPSGIEDMTVRNLSPATQQSYLNAVSKFSRYFGRSPDRLGLEDVHAFQLHKMSTPSSFIWSRRGSRGLR